MQVFLCWSGPHSKKIAQALYDWLPEVIQAVEPWISAEIEKGATWDTELDAALGNARVGILCLTPDNLDSCWLHFEAGALARTTKASRCTFLVGINPEDVRQPLGKFQHTIFEESDVLKLVRTINGAVAEAGEKSLPEGQLSKAFQRLWPELKVEIQPILDRGFPADAPTRQEREILIEILNTVRQLAASKNEKQPAVRGMLHDLLKEKLNIGAPTKLGGYLDQLEGDRAMAEAAKRTIKDFEQKHQSIVEGLKHTRSIGDVLEDELARLKKPDAPDSAAGK